MTPTVPEKQNGFHWRASNRVCLCGAQFAPLVRTSEAKRYYSTPFICPPCVEDRKRADAEAVHTAIEREK